jgi:hypothetical protein
MSWRQRIEDALLLVERRVQAPAAPRRSLLHRPDVRRLHPYRHHRHDQGRNLILQGSFATAGAPEIDRTAAYPVFAEITGMAWDNVRLTVSVQIV